MNRSLFSSLLVAGVILAWTDPAQAQLFGKRDLGTSPTAIRDRMGKSTTSAADATSGTTLNGNERFIRGNRKKDQVVGAGSKETRSFVGLEQASKPAEVKSAVTDLKVETSPDANREGQPLVPKITMYEPRLALGFDHALGPAQERSISLRGRLAVSQSIQWAGPCEVIVEGRTATLRGTVASEHDRKLAELFVLFEPGIAKVRNEIQVASPKPATASPSDRPSQPVKP